ncbi:hypothetical protein RJZ56_004101 [Blastomyces dermatitidis]
MSIAIEFKADAPHFGDAGKAAASTLRSSGVHCAKVYRQDLMTNHPVVDRESSLNVSFKIREQSVPAFPFARQQQRSEVAHFVDGAARKSATDRGNVWALGELSPHWRIEADLNQLAWSLAGKQGHSLELTNCMAVQITIYFLPQFTVRAAYLSLRNPVLQATSAGPKKLSGQE